MAFVAAGSARHGHRPAAAGARRRPAGRGAVGAGPPAAARRDEPGGLLPGLVVGDTSRLDATVEEDFRTTGLTHLTAVSGANVALVLGAVLFLLRWTRAGPALVAVVCAVALAGF